MKWWKWLRIETEKVQSCFQIDGDLSLKINKWKIMKSCRKIEKKKKKKKTIGTFLFEKKCQMFTDGIMNRANCWC